MRAELQDIYNMLVAIYEKLDEIKQATLFEPEMEQKERTDDPKITVSGKND